MHDITHIGFAVMRRVAYGLNVNLRECQSFQGINYLSELRCVSSPERSLESREVAIFWQSRSCFARIVTPGTALIILAYMKGSREQATSEPALAYIGAH